MATTAGPVYTDVSSLANANHAPTDAPFTSFISPWGTSPILFVNNISKEEHNNTPADWKNHYPPYSASLQRKSLTTDNRPSYNAMISHPTMPRKDSDNPKSSNAISLNGDYSTQRYAPDGSLSYSLSPDQVATQDMYYKEIKEKYMSGSKPSPPVGTFMNPKVYIPTSNAPSISKQNFPHPMESKSISEPEPRTVDVPPDYISLEDRLRLCSMDLIRQPQKNSRTPYMEPSSCHAKPALYTNGINSSPKRSMPSTSATDTISTTRPSSSLGDYKSEHKPSGILKSHSPGAPVHSTQSMHSFDLINRPLSVPPDMVHEENMPDRFANYRGTPVPFSYPKYPDIYSPHMQTYSSPVTPPPFSERVDPGGMLPMSGPPLMMDQYGYPLPRPHTANPLLPPDSRDIFTPGPLDYRPRYGQFFKIKTDPHHLEMNGFPRSSNGESHEKSKSTENISRDAPPIVNKEERPRNTETPRGRVRRSNSFHSSDRKEVQPKMPVKEERNGDFVNLSKLKRSLSERREPVYIKQEKTDSLCDDSRSDVGRPHSRSESPDKQRLVSETRSEPDKESGRTSRWDRSNTSHSNYPNPSTMMDIPQKRGLKNDSSFLPDTRDRKPHIDNNSKIFPARAQSVESSSSRNGFPMSRSLQDESPARPNFKSQFMRQFFGEGLRDDERPVSNTLEHSLPIPDYVKHQSNQTFIVKPSSRFERRGHEDHKSRYTSHHQTGGQDSYLNELRQKNNLTRSSATLPQKSADEPVLSAKTHSKEINQNTRLEELKESLKAEQAAHNALKNSMNSRFSYEEKKTQSPKKPHLPRRSRSVHFNEDVTVAHVEEDNDPFQLSSRRLNDDRVASSSQPYYKQSGKSNNYFNFPTYSPRFNGNFSGGQSAISIPPKLETEYSRRVVYPMQF